MLKSDVTIAVLQQIGHFQEVALFGQLFDRVAAIQQLALVAVDEGNLRLAACRRQEAGIVREQTGFAAQGTDIDTIIAMGRRHDREIDGSLSVDAQNCLAFGRHGVNPLYRLCFRSFQGSRQVIGASLLHSYAAWR